MASSKLYFKVDCPHCKKAFATVWNDEIEWTTDAKEALQWRGRQNIDMIAAHDGNVAWPEAAALPVTRWSDDWAEQYECPEAVVARQRPQKASDDEWCSWGSAAGATAEAPGGAPKTAAREPASVGGGAGLLQGCRHWRNAPAPRVPAVVVLRRPTPLGPLRQRRRFWRNGAALRTCCKGSSTAWTCSPEGKGRGAYCPCRLEGAPRANRLQRYLG